MVQNWGEIIPRVWTRVRVRVEDRVRLGVGVACSSRLMDYCFGTLIKERVDINSCVA